VNHHQPTGMIYFTNQTSGKKAFPAKRSKAGLGCVPRHCVSIIYVPFFSVAARRSMVCPTASRPVRVTAP
jgi:hypothetical protein